jgi:transcriptional regulator with XRE-family HTH domain
MNLGSKIKELRKSKGLLQRELAEALECSEKAVSSYERNYRTPDIEMLNKLSSYFNVSVDYLAKDTLENAVREEQAIYSANNQSHLSDVHSLLNIHSNKFTKKQASDLEELIKWYIEKNLK